MAVVRKMTIAVAEDEAAAGYYVVSTYLEGDPGTTRGLGMYRKLTWTEAVDVMLVLFDESRPGQDQSGVVVQNHLW